MNIHIQVKAFCEAWEKQEGYKPAPFQKAIAMRRLERGETIEQIIAAFISARV